MPATAMLRRFRQQVQPSVDSIQEVAIQTSNFAAEYGAVGGGFFNFTMKSGTNQLHGSGVRLLCERGAERRHSFHRVPGHPDEHVGPPSAATTTASPRRPGRDPQSV